MPANKRDLWLILHAKGLADRAIKRFKDNIKDVGKESRLASLMTEKAAKEAELAQRKYMETVQKSELAQMQNVAALQKQNETYERMRLALDKNEIALRQNEKQALRTEIALAKLNQRSRQYIRNLERQVVAIDKEINEKKADILTTERILTQMREHNRELDEAILLKKNDIVITRRRSEEIRNTIRDIDKEIKKIKVEEAAEKLNPRFWKELLTPNRAVLAAMRTGIPGALASPIGVAAVTLAGIFVVTFVGAAITAFATAGLGAVIVGAATAGLIATDEKVKAAANRWVETIKGVFTRSIKPMAKPLIGVFDLFEKSLKRLEPTFTKISEVLAPAIQPLAEGMVGFVEEFFKVLTADPKTLENVRDALAEMGRQLPGLGKALGEFFKTLSDNKDNIENIKDIFMILNGVIKVTGGLLSWLASEFRKAMDFIDQTIADIKAEWEHFSEWLDTDFREAVRGMFDWLENKVKEEWNKLVEDFNQTVDDIKQELDRLKRFHEGLAVGIGMAISNIINGFRTLMDWASRVRDWVRARWNDILNFFRNLPGEVSRLLGAVAAGAFTGGANIVQAIINGMRSRLGPLNGLIDFILRQLDRIPGVNIPKAAGIVGAAVGGGGGGSMKFLAQGGRTPINKPFWVGENGPELMMVSRPGQVFSHEESKQLIRQSAQGSGGGKQITIHQVINVQEIDPRVHAAQLGWELAGRL